MRISKEDIKFVKNMGINNSTKTAFNGFLDATDGLVKVAGWIDGSPNDYIVMYPYYDTFLDMFCVISCGSTDNGKRFDYKEIEFTQDELDLIFNMFVGYYFGSKENFEDYVKQIKEVVNE